MTRRNRSSIVVRLVAAGMAVTVVSACSTLGELVAQPPLVLVDNNAERAVAIGTPDPVTNLPRDKKFDAVYTAFIPGNVVVHPGDTIFFRADSRGEPHTIALGTMVDKAGREISELGLAPLLADLEKLPGLEGIPSVLPLQPVDGKPIRINRSAAEPCYLDKGAPPDSITGGAPACPERSRPSFNGRQTFYSSGWLRDRKMWRLELSGDIKPGTYHVLDLFHRAAQHMTIKVVKKSKALPNIKDVADDTRLESVNQASRLKIPASVAWTAVDPKHLVAGVGAVGSGSFVASFPDETTKMAVGEKATWTIQGMHSITFDAPGDANDGVLERKDGKVEANQSAFKPINSGAVPAAAQGYRAASNTTIDVDGGDYDGTGRKHSGILIGTVEAPTSYSVTFTKAGTYDYYCVVHPVMTGKIKVGEKASGS